MSVPPRPIGVPIQYDGTYWMRSTELNIHRDSSQSMMSYGIRLTFVTTFNIFRTVYLFGIFLLSMKKLFVKQS